MASFFSLSSSFARRASLRLIPLASSVDSLPDLIPASTASSSLCWRLLRRGVRSSPFSASPAILVRLSLS